MPEPVGAADSPPTPANDGAAREGRDGFPDGALLSISPPERALPAACEEAAVEICCKSTELAATGPPNPLVLPPSLIELVTPLPPPLPDPPADTEEEEDDDDDPGADAGLTRVAAADAAAAAAIASERDGSLNDGAVASTGGVDTTVFCCCCSGAV